MQSSNTSLTIDVLNVSEYTYAERLCAATLQGLVNRHGFRLFLDYGFYDDPDARRTNEIFMDDDHWFGKYRELLGNQDQRNLAYYQQTHGYSFQAVLSLENLIRKYRDEINGGVIWDAQLPDTANIALVIASQERLLPIEAGMQAWAESLDIPIRRNLCGQWTNRLECYEWAFKNLFPACKPGFIACIEPGWQRPEFVDYLVQQKIFTYSLSSKSGGLGDTLLLMLAFGPAWLRETIFALHLDQPLCNLGLSLIGRRSPEARLANQIQKAVKAETFPTIFGWHTRRDDELAFMLQLSANGLRLVPTHMAGNFSFHSQVPAQGLSKSVPVVEPELDEQGTYLTFTLSDGDQLMMMSTGELGSWYSPERGNIPFNWETQPLLIDLAPALLEKYVETATPNDCLIAGPSGAGYIIPPLAPDLPDYLEESRRICQKAGIQVITFYVADPPHRIFRQLSKHSQGLTGYLGGYANLGRTPQVKVGEAVYAANQWPTVPHLWDEPETLFNDIHKLLAAPGARPRFIAVHLFAYRITYADTAHFVAGLEDDHIHVVRGDTFLQTMKITLDRRN